jgi:molybdopterin-guanine dinucleotide biosynthesis protein A
MQRDKATIEYRPGESQLDAAVRLLAPRVGRTFVSGTRRAARRWRTRAVIRRSSIVAASRGPIAGISAALG